MSKSTNKGYETVKQADRGYAGHFNSPYSEPMGKPLSLRFPQSLDSFLEAEAKKNGTNKTALVREAVKFFKQLQEERAGNTASG